MIGSLKTSLITMLSFSMLEEIFQTLEPHRSSFRYLMITKTKPYITVYSITVDREMQSNLKMSAVDRTGIFVVLEGEEER